MRIAAAAVAICLVAGSSYLVATDPGMQTGVICNEASVIPWRECHWPAWGLSYWGLWRQSVARRIGLG